MAFLTQGFVKVSGQLKEVKNAWVKMNNAFKKVLTVNEKKGEQWSEVWLPNAPIPAGTIVVWSGTAEEIPSGWLLCDGTNGTPNLIDRFVMGGEVPGETNNGAHTHSLASSGDHAHTLLSVTHYHILERYGSLNIRRPYVGSSSTDARTRDTSRNGGHTHNSSLSGSHDHSGNLNATTVTPPCYALAFIMKG